MFAWLLSSGSVAYAHPLVDEGVRLANEAEFEDALASFASAWNSPDLSRDELITLISQRATVNFALRQSAAVDEDLALLVVLDRQYTFARNVPPPMRERFEVIRGDIRAPQVNVSLSFVARSATLEVDVQGIPPVLQREVLVTAREVGGDWISSREPRVTISNLSAEAVEWFVEVKGPGGAVIVSDGAASAPRRTARPLMLDISRAEPVRREEPEVRRSHGWHWWAIGGGTALAAVATTLAIALTRDSATTSQVSAPVLQK